METYDAILKFLDVNLIYCLIPMIVSLMLTELLFKKVFPTKKALKIVSWAVIIYSLATVTRIVVGNILYPAEFTPYDNTSSYWIIFLISTIFPFTLAIRKLSSKFWYVLLVAFFMKIGVYFEHYVILTTSFERDFAPVNWTSTTINMLAYGWLLVVVQGFLLVVFLIAALTMIEKRDKNVTIH